MKIIPKEKTETYSLPLPLYKSIKIADAICREGKEFDLLIGLDEKYARKLQELSADENDSDLRGFTGDYRRFVEGSYESWYKKNRTIFVLIHKQSDDLAAVIWFGPKILGQKSVKFGGTEERKIDSDWHTISFRSYPQYRGKGMMKSFSEFTINLYKKHFPHAKLWTGTDDRNSAFIRLITSLGFTTDEESSDLAEHWLVMTKV